VDFHGGLTWRHGDAVWISTGGSYKGTKFTKEENECQDRVAKIAWLSSLVKEEYPALVAGRGGLNSSLSKSGGPSAPFLSEEGWHEVTGWWLYPLKSAAKTQLPSSDEEGWLTLVVRRGVLTP